MGCQAAHQQTHAYVGPEAAKESISKHQRKQPLGLTVDARVRMGLNSLCELNRIEAQIGPASCSVS